MTKKQPRSPYGCHCAKCVQEPSSTTAQLHQQINQLAVLLNEKERRQFVGLLARQMGRGGVTAMAEVTGLSRNTIRRGQDELGAGDFNERVRAKGGGRLLTGKKDQAC